MISGNDLIFAVLLTVGGAILILQGVTMNYIDTHKNRIRESAAQSVDLFLGGFETLPPKLQKETIRFLNSVNVKIK